MALLPETEPPLSRFGAGRENTKAFQFFTKSKNYLTEKGALFLNFIRNFLVSNNYVSHAAIIFIALIVLLSNVSDKIAIKRFYGELVYIDPASERLIARSIGEYTYLINNDEEMVRLASAAAAATDGFVSNIGPVETQITSREEPLPDNSTQTVQYVIRDGDTLTGLGWKFDVKLSTLKYVNDLDNVNIIRPGTRIKIPPRGYEVSKEAIAKKEKEKQAKLALANRSTITRSGTSNRAYADSGDIKVDRRDGSRSNGYPYGYCTYYVASRRYVPTNWGNANRWLDSARRAGYNTGSTAAAGAIVVTKESWWGHVAYVEEVSGGQMTIAEMNAKGWGVTSRRTISIKDGVVRGFIY